MVIHARFFSTENMHTEFFILLVKNDYLYLRESESCTDRYEN